ncbi:MAG TPA: hypothetical protein VMV05_03865 [bacterium]|nr:hypothetical protein [bacterium]
MRRWIGAVGLGVWLFTGLPALADTGDSGPDWISQFWQDEKMSLFLRTDYFENSRLLDGQKDLWGGTAQFQAKPSLGDVDGKLNLHVLEPNFLTGGQAAFNLVEGYLAFHLGSLDARVGKISVPWGRADGVNPTDNLTPHDYTLQLPFDEDLRVGLAALKLDYYLDEELDVTLFTTPFFEPSRFPLPGAGGGVSYRVTTPDQTLQNEEVGVKLNKTGGDWDWSVSYFHGFRSLPDLGLASEGAGATVVGVSYSPMDVFGADFAHNLGPFAIRGEAAYTRPEKAPAGDLNRLQPFVMAVFGLDRSFDQELNVNLQIIGRFATDFAGLPSTPDGFRNQVNELNRIVNNQQDANSYEISFRVGDKWMNEALGAEVFGVVDLTRNDSYIRPSVNYAFNDQWTGWVGWDIYRGDANTPFGLLEPTQGFFSEVRYAF